MTKRLTLDFVKSSFEKEGYTLLSKEYKSVKVKLKYVCPKGHVHEIGWSEWNSKRKHRCPYCANNAALNIDIIREEFLTSNYELLDTVYINSKQSFKYRCDNGHVNSMRIDHFRRGIRCPFCSGFIKKSINEVREIIESEGYKLLSDEYKNVHTKLLVQCKKRHQYKVSFHSWLQGSRCPYCNGGIRANFDDIKASIEEEGYALLTDNYENSNQVLELICPNGHHYNVAWNNWKHKGSRCTECSGKGSSINEEAIKEFISDLGIEFISNDKQLIAPYELDIVIPSKKIAIEYCGLYWHSENMGRDRNYHLNKLNMCITKGYRLLTIFEDEFLDNKQMVFSRLLNILNVTNNLKRIYARKCKIMPIPVPEARTFCIENHMQGYTGSSIKLGAFYKGQLVSVMMLAKPSIAKGYKKQVDGVYELSRFCSKKEHIVVGVASKFLTFFKKNYQCSSIFTFADRRWSDGNLYEKIGFSYVSATVPNYWYFKNKKRLHRFALRKTKNDPIELTEREIRKQEGWNRIWDCGNLKYAMEVI